LNHDENFHESSRKPGRKVSILLRKVDDKLFLLFPELSKVIHGISPSTSPFQGSSLPILNPHLFFEKETTSVFRREEVWLRRDA
jgi:hypothetical protein